MARVPVEIFYIPSVFVDPFFGFRAVLIGSWDSNGRCSDVWHETPMVREQNDDGGIRFFAIAMLDAAEVGKSFDWGVWLEDDKGGRQWAIPTEVHDFASQACHRSFVFSGGPQQESYYLTHCRRLGANKYRTEDGTWATRFAVWAPNAQKVEHVFGSMWRADDTGRTLRSEGKLSKAQMAGGYIWNDGRGIDSSYASLAMTRGVDGVWEISLPGDFETSNHQPYMYRIIRDDGSLVYRTDLYSRCQVGGGAVNPAVDQWSGLTGDLSGTVSCSVVIDPETVTAMFDEPLYPESFIPENIFWANEFTGQTLPKRVDDLMIYELHMGALGFGSDKPGTLADAIALLDHIKMANFNAVELLPLSEFGGGAYNWGYATSHYFAIEYGGGGRDKFKYFVKECHQRGLAVIMDVVYNHFVHVAERAEFAYDSTQPEKNIYYWYEGRASDYLLPEGGYVDNQSTGFAPRYWEEMVRKMFISSAITLLYEFHIDGLRVDQTTSIHSYNVLKADNRQTVSSANVFGAKLLRELVRTVRLFKPGTFMLAEDHSEWDELVKPVSEGGLGFDARWYSKFYHHLIGDTNNAEAAKLIYRAGLTCGVGPLSMDRFAGALWATQFSNVVYSESHDEAGNSSGPVFDPTWNGNELEKQTTSHRTIVVAVNNAPLVGVTRRFAEARCRFAWGMTVLSAGVPMVLFGEEVGASKRFKYNAVLANKEDILGMARDSGRCLLRFFSEINRLRATRNSLRSRKLEVVHVHNDNRVLAFRRWGESEDFLIVASLADQHYMHGYRIVNVAISDGGWREIFNSDSRYYGGSDVGNCGATLSCKQGAITVVIPASGFVVFERTY